MGASICPAILGIAALMAAAEKTSFNSNYENSPTRFEFDLCLTAATHIVLTTPEGVVLESWRGDLIPGDTVKLGAASIVPIDTIPLEFTRLRGEHPFGNWYLPGCLTLKSDRCKKPAVFDREQGRRLLLFLTKVYDKEAGEYWWPAASSHQPAIKQDFRPAFGELKPQETVSFTSSALLVEDGVALGIAPGVTGHLQMAVVSRSLPGFRVLIDSVSIGGVRSSCCDETTFGLKALVSSGEEPSFNLKTCLARATDIVVVNEAGRVAEVWKGDTKLGEVIRLSHEEYPGSKRVLFLTRAPEVPSCYIEPLDVRKPQRLVVEYDLLGEEDVYYWPNYFRCLPSYADEDLHPRSRPTTEILDPQFFTQPSSGWLPANESGGFDFSMAFIDQFGKVFTMQRVAVFIPCISSFGPPPYEYRLLPISFEDIFRQQVLEALGNSSFPRLTCQ